MCWVAWQRQRLGELTRSELGELLEVVARRLNPRLRLTGVVFCMHEATTRLAQEVTGDVQAFLAAVTEPACPWYGARLFDARIRRNIRLAEAPSFGQTIFEYAPYSNGASDYRRLAEEVHVGQGAQLVCQA